jgi:hypothetical protein
MALLVKKASALSIGGVASEIGVAETGYQICIVMSVHDRLTQTAVISCATLRVAMLYPSWVKLWHDRQKG